MCSMHARGIDGTVTKEARVCRAKAGLYLVVAQVHDGILLEELKAVLPFSLEVDERLVRGFQQWWQEAAHTFA